MAIILEPNENTTPPASGSLYASVADVRAAVTVPDTVTDEEISQALADAQDAVTGYTGRRFGIHDVVFTVRVRENGQAFLPDPMPTITEVRWTGSDTALDATLWRYQPPAPYEDPYLLVGHQRGYNDLVVGAERYNGGWANLYRHCTHVQVTGTAGTGSIPSQVKRATVLLACWLLGLVGTDDGPAVGVDDLAGVSAISREGYSVTFATPRAQVPVGVVIPTTGLPAADRLLAAQVRRDAGLGVA